MGESFVMEHEEYDNPEGEAYDDEDYDVEYDEPEEDEVVDNQEYDAPAAPNRDIPDAPSYRREGPAQNMGGGQLPEHERPSWNQNVDGAVANEMRRNHYGGSISEAEQKEKTGPIYDIYRRVNLYPQKKN